MLLLGFKYRRDVAALPFGGACSRNGRRRRRGNRLEVSISPAGENVAGHLFIFELLEIAAAHGHDHGNGNGLELKRAVSSNLARVGGLTPPCDNQRVTTTRSRINRK